MSTNAAVNGSSQGTRRFQMFVIGTVALVAVGIVLAALKVDSAIIVSVMTPLVTFLTGAYLGGSWHDKNTRVATTGAIAETAKATADPAVVESVAKETAGSAR